MGKELQEEKDKIKRLKSDFEAVKQSLDGKLEKERIKTGKLKEYAKELTAVLKVKLPVDLWKNANMPKPSLGKRKAQEIALKVGHEKIANI